MDRVRYRYDDRVAVDGLTQSVSREQLFLILGPNGSGKSTLFKLISTLIPLQEGEIFVDGLSVRTEANSVRQRISVVFQYPSLDRKLTVQENIECQAALVGLRGQMRRQRVAESMALMKITDRANERAERLSGGLKRRVELAKGILHQPSVLLLDEPSTGLDPSARLDLWAALQELKTQFGTTVVMTTHLLEEAEKADTIAIMNRGKLVAQDSPENLRRAMGSNIVTVTSRNPANTQQKLLEQFGWVSELVGNEVRINSGDVAQRISELAIALGDSVDSVTLARPSLEDVFVTRTGEHFSDLTKS
jgi:ABC-2 type transport system ATP-binding protein